MKGGHPIKLSDFPAGATGKVHSIAAGEELRSRLLAMGIYPGREIRRAEHSSLGGPIVAEVAGSTVALGHGMAEKILISGKTVRILLAGNPNVGKSVVFSRLTGLEVASSNYPGTTVEFTEGQARLAGRRVTIVDVPGAYSMAPTCQAEDVACRLLADSEFELVIQVVDATNLERNLYFALQVMEMRKPVIILLNKWDSAKLKGIHIDTELLSRKLGAPVVPFVAVSGEGIRELEKHVSEAIEGNLPACPMPPKSEDDKWRLIGELSRQAQKIEHKHPSILERLAELSIRHSTGIPIALLTMAACFFAVRSIGEGLINHALDPLYHHAYEPLILKLAALVPPEGVAHKLLFGTAMESFGILTTGIYISAVAVLGYIISFYLVLGFLEDLGYLPRMAVLLDSALHKIGLHGYGSIPILLGMGCKVPGILAVRVLETRRERIIAATLVMLLAPCMPQSAMMMTLLAPYGLFYTAAAFGSIALCGILAGYALNKLMKGETPELFVEIPPYGLPDARVMFTKLKLRVKSYLYEAVPMIMLGVLAVNLLERLGALDLLARIFEKPVIFLFGLPPESVSVMVLGFLRKDISISLLIPFHLPPWQIVTASVFLSLYMPCMAAGLVMLKELGWRDWLKVAALNLLAACAAGFALNLAGRMFGL